MEPKHSAIKTGPQLAPLKWTHPVTSNRTMEQNSSPPILRKNHGLSENLLLSMRVAGPADRDGRATPLRAAELHRSTGIARSTLRELRNPKNGAEANPDLRTLTRLANALGLPVAFLLMRPEDWEMLCAAINNLRDPHDAATQLFGAGVDIGPDIAEKVLTRCGVHPSRLPITGISNSLEQGRIAEGNERVRRASYVLAALMQLPTRNEKSRTMLTALAAAMANQTRSASLVNGVGQSAKPKKE